jgi:membrane-associated protein
MELLRDFFSRLHSLEELIRWGGYAVLVAIVFAETGLLIGFFLPGDSLLMVAGLFAARGHLDITLLILLLCVAAIAGDTVGYWFGKKTGARLFARSDSRWFKREHLLKTQAFYEQHGGKTIVLARFIPLLRTFAPIVAGVAGMEYRRFVAYNIFGGIGWVTSMTLVGYWLGSQFAPDQLDRYLHLIIAGIIALSILPPIVHTVRERRRRAPASLPTGEAAEREQPVAAGERAGLRE